MNDQDEEVILSYQEFHPLLYKQHEHLPFKEFETFNKVSKTESKLTIYRNI